MSIRVIKEGSIDRRFELEKTIVAGMSDMSKAVFSMGLALKEIKEDFLWRLTNTSLDDYTRETFGYGKSWAYALIAIYDRFYPIYLSHTDTPVDVTRMFKLLPFTTDDNAEELYLMAAETNWTGFENNIKNMSGRRAVDECVSHEWMEIRRCKKCGVSEKL